MSKHSLLPFFALLLVWSCEREHLYHDVIIENGTGSGNYRLGSAVDIEANPPAERHLFSHWDGDVFVLSDPMANPAEFDMPLQDVFLEAIYAEVPYYQLQVNQGSGSGEYPEGATVTIQAETARTGWGFKAWSGNSELLADSLLPTTTLIMPPQNVTLEATYQPTTRYRLLVIEGDGDGTYFPGARIRVEADEHSEDYQFRYWTGDTMFMDRTDSLLSYLTMPEQDVTIEAIYEEVEVISFSQEVFPLITRKCSYDGCHNGDGNTPYLTSYENIVNAADDITWSISTGYMPSVGTLSEQEKNLILTWIKNGAPNN